MLVSCIGAEAMIIEGIFNYCTRRCELCPFTERCTLFQSEREYERRKPDATWTEHVHDSFAETLRLLQEWCKREGIDFDEVRRDADSDELCADIERADRAVRSDPLQKLATSYTVATLKIVDALSAARASRGWSTEAQAAFDTITWHAGMVAAKVHRALHGYREHGQCGEEDPVQNDWNGSAKLARIVIAESKAAWEVMLREGRAASDSPLLELVTLLDDIDLALADRFRRAMDFVRPGFDRDTTAQRLPLAER